MNLNELLTNLRVTMVEREETEHGPVYQIWIESMTSDLLGGRVSVVEEVYLKMDRTDWPNREN